MDELSAWVEMPLPEYVGCVDMNERMTVADVEVREALLGNSGMRSITEFQLQPKERQKDVIREVMRSLSVGARQMSRICELSYSTIYYIWKSLNMKTM